jgi:hypothetical protein
MSKKQQEQEVVEAKSQEVAALSQDLDAWGDNEASSRDIIIPKILCMQSTSELVTDGGAKMGDFVDSLTSEVLGNIDNPVKFIPFHMEKVYIISKKVKGASRFEFVQYEPVANQNYPFEEEVGDDTIKYEYTLQFYCLREEDTSLPYVLSFKSTSLRAGKVLSTQMYVRNKAAGLVPPAYTMELSGRKDKNDQGTFVVMEVKAGNKTSPELIGECLNWFKIIKSGKARVAPEAAASGSGNYASEETNY